MKDYLLNNIRLVLDMGNLDKIPHCMPDLRVDSAFESFGTQLQEDMLYVVSWEAYPRREASHSPLARSWVSI